MLNVVAAKTGYPAEMVGLDMDLETDLGVDSIKRVEILSAVTEQAPGLPEVSAARMAGMRTLREDGAQKVLAGMTSAAEVMMITTGDSE